MSATTMLLVATAIAAPPAGVRWDLPWNWTSPAWILGAAMLVAYVTLFPRERGRRLWCAVAAAALLVAVFVTPLGPLADGYLFSAHIAQHMLLLMVVPLLAVASLPSEPVERVFRGETADRFGRFFAVPMVGWLLGLGAMWLWHEPTACSASIANPVVGVVRDASFVLAGSAFWWPIAGPVERARLSPSMSLAYLVAACIGCTLLGIYITFASIAVCPAFAFTPVGSSQLRDFVLGLRAAGFTPAIDQQLGGLIMWVPPCLLYATASLHAVSRWHRPVATSQATRCSALSAEIVP